MSSDHVIALAVNTYSMTVDTSLKGESITGTDNTHYVLMSQALVLSESSFRRIKPAGESIEQCKPNT